VSLIEVMMVLAILGVVIALAAQGMGDWLLNAQIRTAAESIQNGLQNARNEAVRRNVPVEFVLGTGSAWTVRLASVGTVVETRTAGEGSKDVVVTATPNGATTVSFNGMGQRMTANTDGSTVLTTMDIDLPATVLAAEKTRDLRVVIGLGGQIRMCDPNVSDTADTRHC
jgi:type IV fimbrial biogenesis protein FimT